MQNAVIQNIRNGLGFYVLRLVTYPAFGNNPANGLVTKILQFFTITRFSTMWKNEEYPLIMNGLRDNRTDLKLLAFSDFTHTIQRGFAIGTGVYHRYVGVVSFELLHQRKARKLLIFYYDCLVIFHILQKYYFFINQHNDSNEKMKGITKNHSCKKQPYSCMPYPLFITISSSMLEIVFIGELRGIYLLCKLIRLILKSTELWKGNLYLLMQSWEYLS